MKIHWKILFVALCLSFMYLFKPRQDIVLGAVDKSQYIKLFEQGQEFELCIDENNIFTGIYACSTDTVFLFYLKHLEYSSINLTTCQPENSNQLPKKLFINPEESNIESADGESFSASIYKDLRHKTFEKRTAGNPVLKERRSRIFAEEPNH
jgi:hypothetical protein